MKTIGALVLLAATLAGSSSVMAFGEWCGPGCHTSLYGACVAEGWESGARVRNECPAGFQPRPPCPRGYAWRGRMKTCFPK